MTEKFYRDIAALREPSLALAEPKEADFALAEPKTSGLVLTEPKEASLSLAEPKTSSLALAEPSATDIISWITDQLKPCRGDAILEIGCGYGKRTLPLARIVGETGYILAIDRSYEALNTLSQYSLEKGLETRIRFLQISPDHFGGHVRADYFDRALGSHSLSHIKHPRMVFSIIQQALKPSGIFFFYGPTHADHAEFRHFHADLCGELSASESLEPTFMEEVGMQYAHDFFSDIETVKFEQPLRFDSPEALHACWSVSKLYNEDLEQAFLQAAEDHFASHRVFETIHRVIGIKAVK